MIAPLRFFSTPSWPWGPWLPSPWGPWEPWGPGKNTKINLKKNKQMYCTDFFCCHWGPKKRI